MKKRVFNALLALVICLSLLPVFPAAAAESDGEIIVSADSAASGIHWGWTVDGAGGGTLLLDSFSGDRIVITANGGIVHVKLRGDNAIHAALFQTKHDLGAGEFLYDAEEIGLKVIDSAEVHLAPADAGSRGTLAITCITDPDPTDQGIVAGIRTTATNAGKNNAPKGALYVEDGAYVSVLVDSHWKAGQHPHINTQGVISYFGLRTDTTGGTIPIYTVKAGGRLDITVNTVEQDIFPGYDMPPDQSVTLIAGYSGSSGQVGHVYGELHLTYGGPDLQTFGNYGFRRYDYNVGPVTVFEGAYVELHSTQKNKLDTVVLNGGLFSSGRYYLNRLMIECTMPEYHMNGQLPDTVWQKPYSDVAIWADGLGEGYAVNAKNVIIYPVTIPNKPRDVELLSNRDGRVELKPVEVPLYGSIEYGILDIDNYVDSNSLPATWQASTVFEGLTGGHDYKFFARLKPLEGKYLTPENGTLETAGFVTVKGKTQVCTLSNAAFRYPDSYLDLPDRVVVGAGVEVQAVAPADKRYEFVDWTIQPQLEHQVEYGILSFVMPDEPVRITANYAIKPTGLFPRNCELPGIAMDQYYNYKAPAGTIVTAKPVPPEAEKPGQRWTFQNWTVQLMSEGTAVKDVAFTQNADGTITFTVPELPQEHPFAAVEIKANYTDTVDPLTDITVRCDSTVLQNKAFDGQYLNIPAGELFINDQPWNNLTDERIGNQVTLVWRDPITKEPVPVCSGDSISAGTVVLGPVSEGSYEFAVQLDGVDKFTRTVTVSAPAAFSIDETMTYGGTQEFSGLKWNVPLEAIFCGDQRLWDEAARYYAPNPMRMTLIARWFDAEGKEIPISRKYAFEGLSGPSTAGTFHAQLWYVPYLATLEYLPETIDFSQGRKVCDLEQTFTTTPDTFVKLTSSNDWYPTQQYGKLRLYATVGKVGDQLYLMSGEADGNRLKAVPITPESDGSLLLGDSSAFLVWPLNEYGKVRENEKVAGWDYVPYKWRLSNATKNEMTLWLSRMGFDRPTGDDQHTIALDPAKDYELHWDCFIDQSTMCFGRDAVDGELYFFGYYHGTPEGQYSEFYPIYFYWNKNEWVEPPKPEINDYVLMKTLDKEYDGKPVTVNPYKELMINKWQTDWDDVKKMNGAHVEWQDAKGQPLTNLAPEKPDGPDQPGEPLLIGPSQPGDYHFVVYEWDDKVKEPPKDDPTWKPGTPVKVEKLRVSFTISPSKEPPKPDGHIHTADQWQYSGTQHWHICNNAACGAQFDLAPHSFQPDKKSENTQICTVCGYREVVHRANPGETPAVDPKEIQGRKDASMKLEKQIEEPAPGPDQKPIPQPCSVTYDPAAVNAIAQTAELNKASSVALLLDNVTAELNTSVNTAQQNAIAEQQKISGQSVQVYNVSLVCQSDDSLVPITDFGSGSCFIRVPAPAWYTGQGDLTVSRVETDGTMTAMPQVHCVLENGCWFVEWKSDSHSTYLLQKAEAVLRTEVKDGSVLVELTPSMIAQNSTCIAALYCNGQMVSLGMVTVEKYSESAAVKLDTGVNYDEIRVFLLDLNSTPLTRQG